jgi:hypothetical protein
VRAHPRRAHLPSLPNFPTRNDSIAPSTAGSYAGAETSGTVDHPCCAGRRPHLGVVQQRRLSRPDLHCRPDRSGRLRPARPLDAGVDYPRRSSRRGRSGRQSCPDPSESTKTPSTTRCSCQSAARSPSSPPGSPSSRWLPIGLIRSPIGARHPSSGSGRANSRRLGDNPPGAGRRRDGCAIEPRRITTRRFRGPLVSVGVLDHWATTFRECHGHRGRTVTACSQFRSCWWLPLRILLPWRAFLFHGVRAVTRQWYGRFDLRWGAWSRP